MRFRSRKEHVHQNPRLPAQFYMSSFMKHVIMVIIRKKIWRKAASIHVLAEKILRDLKDADKEDKTTQN
jgi:hypothetical protein